MFFILLLKGFIIGIAFIIPGVSGGTLAIYLGVYDQMLHAITHVFKEFKKSFFFLLPILLGVGASVVLLAKLLGWFIDRNSFITLLFFIGLLLGGIPSLLKTIKGKPIKASGFIAFFIAFIIVVGLLIGKLNNNTDSVDYFSLNLWTILLIFTLGMAAAATMVIPGVSGSALLITLGFYTAIVTNVVGNILDFTQFAYNIQVIIPFLLGAVVGIFLISHVLELSLKKFQVQTYMAILGFIIASAIVILFEIKDPQSAVSFTDQTPIFLNLWGYITHNPLTVLIGILALSAGIFGATKLVEIDRLFSHDKNQER